MATYLMESVILAFTIGAIVGAIVALHLAHGPIAVKAQDELEHH